MRIGIDPWPGYAPLHLARHLGALPDRDFRLVEFSTTSESSRSFRNGIIEATCTTLDDALRAQQSDLDLVVVLAMDESIGGDALIARPGIKSLAELKGRRIAVDVGSVSTFLLARALEHGGLALTDVTPVYLPIDRHLPAFRAGEVDAAATYEPTRTRLLELGGIDLFNSTKIPGEIVDVLIVRRDYLQKHPERGAALRKAWFAALEHLRRSRGDSMAVMAARTQTKPADLESSLTGVKLADEAANQEMLGGSTPTLKTTAGRLRKVMREKGLLSGDVNIEPMFSFPPRRGESR
jgi:NitT/TauT family transport system substrate-binding protein